jgi:hypothetical protein
MVKNEQDGKQVASYVKLLPESVNQTLFNGTSPYYIMFGYDPTRYEKDRVRLILRKRDIEFTMVEPIKLEFDTRTHMFAFIMYPDMSFEVRIDDVRVRDGKLYDKFPAAFEEPFVYDPKAPKPDDWEDYPEIPDPKERKPLKWDQPMTIVDPFVKKPADWDDDQYGPWKENIKPNPDYKGTWMTKLTKNPKYKGPWKGAPVPNPDWPAAMKRNAFKKIRYVGIDVYQPENGTIWDNFFIGTDLTEYRQFVKLHWDTTKRYEDVYDSKEKAESFSLSGKDLQKRQEDSKKAQAEWDSLYDEDLDADDDDDDDDL